MGPDRGGWRGHAQAVHRGPAGEARKPTCISCIVNTDWSVSVVRAGEARFGIDHVVTRSLHALLVLHAASEERGEAGHAVRIPRHQMK